MIYSCRKAGYLLCDFPLSQKECRFLFSCTHPGVPVAAPALAQGAGGLRHAEQVCMRNRSPMIFLKHFCSAAQGKLLPFPCHIYYPWHGNWNAGTFFLQILWKGRWVSRPIKLFSTTTHIKWDAAVTMQDVVSMENRQTGHDSVIWYRRADLVLHEKFQFCFPL